MRYSYACSNGHPQEYICRIGDQPLSIRCCTCDAFAERDYHADFSGATIAPMDPYRTYHLSSARQRAEGEQQRRIDAPSDSFERRRLEKSLGRTYVGNDTSMMSRYARAGIEAYRDKFGKAA